MDFDFRFKHFGINHFACAMKVGTDGVLLGAWAKGGARIIDIGTGTGLIALMMAQRYPLAHVLGVEIDDCAAQQALSNVEASPFAKRIDIVCDSVQHWCEALIQLDERFDALVCNPPFYANSLPSRSTARDVARCADSLSVSELMMLAATLLTDDGELSLILPASMLHETEERVADYGLFVHRCTLVSMREGKPVKRVLLSVGRKPVVLTDCSEEVLMTADGVRSKWYTHLTHDFYL